jgi:integrase/recombinase XerD
MTATPQRELTSRLETLAASEERGEVTTADAEAIRSFIAAFDPNNSQHTSPDGETTLEPGSLSVYVKNLTEAARRVALVDGTAADVNGVLHSLSNEGRKPWTVHGYSTALRRFYGFHEFGPDADEITRIDTPTGSSFDPDDVLTREELHELLDAADNPRDQAVVALLIYPSACNTCGEQLPPAAKACPGCGEVYTPDAVGAPPSLTPENVERLEQLIEELGPLVDTNSDVEDT